MLQESGNYKKAVQLGINTANRGNSFHLKQIRLSFD